MVATQEKISIEELLGSPLCNHIIELYEEALEKMKKKDKLKVKSKIGAKYPDRENKRALKLTPI